MCFDSPNTTYWYLPAENHTMDIVAELRGLLGAGAVLDREALGERAAGIWRQDHLQARALVRPASTAEVSRVLRFCHAHSIELVTQGGLTGLVRGADAGPQAVILSTERLNRIESVDPGQRCATVQAGVTLQALQEAVSADGLMFPLDLGARGSATLGGNAATNAGGNRVIRYGMMRDMVLGLEVVLADGSVLSSMNQLLKNNTGYDLRQLFIGSEGTLGVITRLNLRLREAPAGRNMALAGVESFTALAALLKHMDRELGGALSAFEALWNGFYRLVTSPPAAGRPPLAQHYPYYALIEAQGADPELDEQRFMQALESALAAGLIADAAVSHSEGDCLAFWALRDDVDQVYSEGHTLMFDISLPLAQVERYVSEVAERLAREVADGRHWVWGHLGDGNLHLAVQMPEATALQQRARVEEILYSPLAAFKGAVSAEHGIGLDKKAWLRLSRSAQEIEAMRRIKAAFDPAGILNPGKIL